ncbi:MAG: sialate O-acetylesterase [Gemmataceae bacterium]
MNRLSLFVFLLVSATSSVTAQPAGKKLPLPGESFTLSNHVAFLIPSSNEPIGRVKPWVWYAPTLPNLPGSEERWMFERFREAGIAIAGIDAGESYGSPAGNRIFDSLYDSMVKRGYSTKPVMLGRSRGGLMTLSWAAANPGKVAGFAGIYPVCDLASYPGIEKAAGAYEMKPDELRKNLTRLNPVDLLDGLAQARVPLFAIHGDVDTVVPLEANSLKVKTRYAERGGTMTLIVPPKQGHNMWPGFFQCQELVEFVIAHAGVGMRLDSPQEWQVVQRNQRNIGSISIQGRLFDTARSADAFEYRVGSKVNGMGPWRKLAGQIRNDRMEAMIDLPAGGWYQLDVRALKEGKTVAETRVSQFGVGEVFVVAGQSNSANHGEEKQSTRTKRVSSWDGQRWQLANDPQPGASGSGGSFLPPLGDAIATRFDVPVGFISCGVGATSVREWLPKGIPFSNPPTLEGNVRKKADGTWESKGELFETFCKRMKPFGPHGFRAVLWHQGESDANQKDSTRTLPGKQYRESLERLIRDSRKSIGWEAPWFVAQASYHVPGDEGSTEIRSAQASLWKDKIAFEGPDSDAIKGSFRDNQGQGVHFSGAGLREHAARWADKITPWLEQQTELPRVGYTELRTNLPGGRHANVRTMRAHTVRMDGLGTQPIGRDLIKDPDEWTQFAGWSPEGKTATIGLGWQSPDNAQWEESHKQFRMGKGQWRLDSCLVDPATGKSKNVTAVDRVSHYNGGLFYLPGGKGFGFTGLINGISKPFTMDRDGRNKTDVSGQGNGFTYGYQASPDGQSICYHENYQIYVSHVDGSHKIKIQTGHPFDFAPQWSPDGQWLLFVSGEHENCHPTIVRPDGTGLKQLASRNGYKGVTEFLDVPDFHSGSSDLPVWSTDGKAVYYTAKVDRCIELFRVSLDGSTTRLTHSTDGTTHYHPATSPDGNWLVYGSRRNGVRNLYVRNLIDGRERPITDLKTGSGAMWPHWQPVNSAPVK